MNDVKVNVEADLGKVSKDILFTTDSAKEYINKHILGLTVLSK